MTDEPLNLIMKLIFKQIHPFYKYFPPSAMCVGVHVCGCGWGVGGGGGGMGSTKQ